MECGVTRAVVQTRCGIQCTSIFSLFRCLALTDRYTTPEIVSRVLSWIPRDPAALIVLAVGVAAIQCAPYPDLRAWMIVGMLASGGGTLYLWLNGRLTTPQVILGAVAARLAAFPLGPSVTDDTFRYIWDGWVQLDGMNPYALRPEEWMAAADPIVSERYQDLYDRLNSTSYFSVYPPVSQLIFALGAGVDAALGGRGDVLQSYYTIKAAFLAIEVGAVALLARMVSPRTLVLYAWSPLVVLETAGQGHTEAAVVAFLVATVWAVREGRAWIASGALAGAAMVKLFPVLLFPLLWRRFRWAGIAPGVFVMGLLSIPYLAPFVPSHVMTSLNLYVRLFEFFAGPYFAVKHMLLAVVGADLSKIIGPVFRVVFLAGVPVVYVLDAWRNWQIERSMLWILGGFLALSTTVHPWYLISLMPLVCMRMDRSATSLSDTVFSISTGVHGEIKAMTRHHLSLMGWLWLSVIAPATYGYYVGQPYWIWVWIGWGGATLFVLASLMLNGGMLQSHLVNGLSRIQRWRSRAKAARVLPWLPMQPSAISSRAAASRSAPLVLHDHNDRVERCTTVHHPAVRVLDLGAGEGFVGEAITVMASESASGPTTCTVRLCDIQDINRTGLPHDTYDGQMLPYADDAFDAVVLYFVLHHCQYPERVLAEALRVAFKRVVVVESIVTGPIQHRLLRAADITVNRIRTGGSLKAQEQHLSFRSADAWKHVAEEQGAEVVDITLWSGWIHPQARLIIEPSN